jgi:hypothetical protein
MDRRSTHGQDKSRLNAATDREDASTYVRTEGNIPAGAGDLPADRRLSSPSSALRKRPDRRAGNGKGSSLLQVQISI